MLKCDFLNVTLLDRLDSCEAVENFYSAMKTHNEVVTGLLLESFHVVVFSLLLEYLPTSKQRVKCCQTAWQLLATDGLLVIITPDSRRQHRNRRVAVDWRHDIESIGFVRWRYEKLEHIHCMAFRKVVNNKTGSVGSPECVDTALQIPQDYHKADDDNEVQESSICSLQVDDNTTCSNDNELPVDCCDIFS